MVKYIKNNIGLILVRILAALPVVFWVSIQPLSERFASPVSAFRSLGQLAGLTGMALLSINFILSARFKFLDKWFQGLNKVYDRHHFIGALAFSLLLFHPALLTVQYLFISLSASFDFLFSFNDFGVLLGETALLVFVILMVITFYVNFKYQNWKNTHKFLGIVLFLGALHMILVPSDVSRNAGLEFYMLSLASLGALSYLYRTVFGIYKRREYKYKLERVIKVNDNIVELILSPESLPMKYLAGQFVFIRFEVKGILSESHPFSLASGGSGNALSLGVKALGDYTSMVYLLNPGAICRIEGPFGTFSFTKAVSKRQIWVAGGIGITPFLGMARRLTSADLKDYEIDLYYSVKSEKDAVFVKELAEIAGQNSSFRLHPHVSEKEGHISASKIVSDNKDVSQAEIFLCGPLPFMQSMRTQFIKSGFDKNKIYSEEFNLQK